VRDQQRDPYDGVRQWAGHPSVAESGLGCDDERFVPAADKVLRHPEHRVGHTIHVRGNDSVTIATRMRPTSLRRASKRLRLAVVSEKFGLIGKCYRDLRVVAEHGGYRGAAPREAADCSEANQTS